MLRQVPRDIWIGLATLVLAGAYWFGADRIPISPLDGAVNAAAMPKALAYALGALALVLIFRAVAIEVITRRATAAAATEGKQKPTGDTELKAAGGEDAATRYKRHLRAAGMLASGILYLVIVPYLGYMLSIALLVFTVAAYMQARPDRKLLILSGAIAVFFYLLFVRFLDIPLPAGFWQSLVS